LSKFTEVHNHISVVKSRVNCKAFCDYDMPLKLGTTGSHLTGPITKRSLWPWSRT